MVRALPPGRLALAATLALGVVFAGLPVAPASAEPPDRQRQYEAAAAEFGVPVEVLLGVSYLQSRWDTNAGTPSTSGGYGPMHLTDAEVPAGPPAAALQTIDPASALTGEPVAELRTDPYANLRGGAALLASYQRELGAPAGAGSDPAEWYGAVARYSGAATVEAATAFADEVYAQLRAGAQRTTDDGQLVRLVAEPALQPDKGWASALGLRRLERRDGVECPIRLSCEWIPAPYELRGDGSRITSYGNHDLGNRPKTQQIEYIVIHDTEGSYETTLNLVQNKNYVSWQYTLRSVDGHIAQHVKAKDVAWHAGNWYVNAKAIGLEHEGFAAQGTWYTETMYRTSAKLVRYLALRLGIPLDRQHIVGHDNVPGILPNYVAGMHWDPGPYWDWAHYFDLLGAPLRATGGPRAGLVTINPDFHTNRPAFTGCEAGGVPCPSRGSSAVILRSAPEHDAPLVTDPGLRPDGSPSTMHISDHGARASTGQQYAVADRAGDWTAIWYLGQKAWFHNPADAPAAVPATGFVVTPKPGLDSVPVYGRAYPEAAAYPEGVPAQAVVPLQYDLLAGQRYAVGRIAPSEYYRAVSYDHSLPGDGTVIRGDTTYVQIQFGHRYMFVNLDDVRILPAALG
jgi:hypothetical protein